MGQAPQWATLIRAKNSRRKGDCNMVILALVSPRTHMAISTHKPRYTKNKNAGAHVTFATWVNVAHLSWPLSAFRVLRPASCDVLYSSVSLRRRFKVTKAFAGQSEVVFSRALGNHNVHFNRLNKCRNHSSTLFRC